MNSVKFHGLVKIIESRMRDCQVIDDADFTKCLYGNLASLDHAELEKIVVKLFKEHTNLTSLINDVSDLVTTSQKFSVLFDDNN